MRWSLAILPLALSAMSAFAFNSEKWLAERGDDSDMLRLQSAYDECEKKIDIPAENVMFPIETYPNGVPKSKLVAKKAFMFVDTGFIWGEGIRVERYRQDGKTVEAFLTADNCIVDRKTKSGWVKGNAHMDWNGVSIKGRGIYFSFDREFIKIFSQTEIRTKSIRLDSKKVLEK